MKVLGSYEKARLYIETHSASEFDSINQIRKIKPGPCITVSRQTGIGAEKICQALIDYFKERANSYYSDWAYFDKNLIDKVLADHDLPPHFKAYLEEERSDSIDSIFSQILKIQPHTLKLLHKTSNTILQLARYGNVIIIGRGSNLITRELNNVLHLRFVAPLEFRIRNAQELYKLSRSMARSFIEAEDKSRKDYIRKYFHKDIEDPANYHFIMNTCLLSYEEIAEAAGSVILKRFPYAFNVRNECYSTM